MTVVKNFLSELQKIYNMLKDKYQTPHFMNANEKMPSKEKSFNN